MTTFATKQGENPKYKQMGTNHHQPQDLHVIGVCVEERKGEQWGQHLMGPKIANSCSLESMVGQFKNHSSDRFYCVQWWASQSIYGKDLKSPMLGRISEEQKNMQNNMIYFINQKYKVPVIKIQNSVLGLDGNIINIYLINKPLSSVITGAPKVLIQHSKNFQFFSYYDLRIWKQCSEMMFALITEHFNFSVLVFFFFFGRKLRSKRRLVWI